jgi:Protein of unknown function (DUF1353)
MAFRTARFLLGLFAALLSGCATPGRVYRETGVGRFHGNPKVIWKAPNSFTFIQDNASPFYYVTSRELGSQKIVPRTMKTDGGSIPRPYWIFADLTPWQFLPAYLIHDELYEEHHRKGNPPDEAGFQRSAKIVTEAIKTLMVTRCDMNENSLALLTINVAVRGEVARDKWNGIPRGPWDCSAPGHDCLVNGHLCAEVLAGKHCKGAASKCNSRLMLCPCASLSAPPRLQTAK